MRWNRNKDRRRTPRAVWVPVVVGAVTAPVTVGPAHQAWAAGDSVSAAQGSGQNTNIGTTFPIQLGVTVSGPSGDSGTVTFAAPSSGAGGYFSGPGAANGGLTDVIPYTLPGSGGNSTTFATADPLVANGVSGPYQVTATASGGGAPASFNLTNDGISASGGTPQTAKLGAAFASPLTATVYAYGAPVAGASVTFTAPASGASAVFSSSNTNTVTVPTNSQGVATAALSANGVEGSYSVTATTTASGAAGTPSWSLTNTPAGVTSGISAYSGSGQSTAVGTQFGAPLVAQVIDPNGNPVGGVPVTFSIQTNDGAGATFTTGGANATETTDPSGKATSPPLTANDTGGSYNATASVTGVSSPATYALTNIPGGPQTVTAGLGANQAAPVGTTFPVPLSVTVTDSNDNPVPGATVTFSAPASGASGTFAGSGATASVTTDDKGVAVAPPFTADGTPGGYIVTASAPGATSPASFALVNQAGGSGSGGSGGGTHLAAPIVGMAPTPDGKGYWLVGADGGVFTYGDAGFYGSAGGIRLASRIVGMAATPDGKGYWLVAADGGVFTYGNASFHGSAGGIHLASPVVGMSATPGGGGYWLVAADGGVFTYGNASFHGSAGGLRLVSPVVGMAATPDGAGYWLVASDGGVFTYGDASFHGSAGGLRLVSPVVGMAAAPDGAGYRLAAADGGVFTYGDAGFRGSAAGTPAGPGTVAVAPMPGGGYWLADTAGTVTPFGGS